MPNTSAYSTFSGCDGASPLSSYLTEDVEPKTTQCVFLGSRGRDLGWLGFPEGLSAVVFVPW